jgi:TonB family protein
MRRMILISLVLSPVMAHAQAVTTTGHQPSSTSAKLYAEVYRPAAPSEAAAVSTPMSNAPAANHLQLRESVRTRTADDFAVAALHMGGTLEYSMKGSAPTQVSAPSVVTAVEISMSDRELSEQPAVTTLVVHTIVDENGTPRNVVVTQSSGRAVLDQRAVAAVGQYRFKPAMLDNKATWASVYLTIKLERP